MAFNAYQEWEAEVIKDAIKNTCYLVGFYWGFGLKGTPNNVKSLLPALHSMITILARLLNRVMGIDLEGHV